MISQKEIEEKAVEYAECVTKAEGFNDVREDFLAGVAFIQIYIKDASDYERGRREALEEALRAVTKLLKETE